MKTKTYTYRNVSEPHDITEREFDIFEEPEFIHNEGEVYEKIPNQSTSGWVSIDYLSEDGTMVLSEFWKHKNAPEYLHRDGQLYKRQFGTPTIVDKFRMGSGILDHTPKAFQDIMKAAKKRAGNIE